MPSMRQLSVAVLGVALLASLCSVFFLLGQRSSTHILPAPPHSTATASVSASSGQPGSFGAVSVGSALQPISKTLAFAKALFQPARFKTHLSTDKPMYRPGETMRIRGVVLGVAGMAFVPDDVHVGAQVKIVGPKGPVATNHARVKASTLGYQWQIPRSLKGGKCVWQTWVGGPACALLGVKSAQQSSVCVCVSFCVCLPSVWCRL